MSEKRTVIVADDDEATRESLKLLFRLWGWEPKVARDGVEAWELLQETRAALLVTDNQMPHRSGLELIRLVRGSEQIGTVPIILMTGHHALQLGPMDPRPNVMLLKPVDPFTLRDFAEQLVVDPAR